MNFQVRLVLYSYYERMFFKKIDRECLIHDGWMYLSKIDEHADEYLFLAQIAITPKEHFAKILTRWYGINPTYVIRLLNILGHSTDQLENLQPTSLWPEDLLIIEKNQEYEANTTDDINPVLHGVYIEISRIFNSPIEKNMYAFQY